MSDWYCKKGHPVPTPPRQGFGRVWCPPCETYLVPVTEHELKVLNESKAKHPSTLDGGRVVGKSNHDILCPSCGSHILVVIENVSTQLAPLPEMSAEEKAALKVSAQSIVPL